MSVNIEIIFLDFLKNDFLDLRGLWFGRQFSLWLSLLFYILHYKTNLIILYLEYSPKCVAN